MYKPLESNALETHIEIQKMKAKHDQLEPIVFKLSFIKGSIQIKFQNNMKKLNIKLEKKEKKNAFLAYTHGIPKGEPQTTKDVAVVYSVRTNP